LDEPFYAYYLKQTGIAHPGRDEVIAAYETDFRKVIRYICGPIPGGKSVWYQKHMAHHMLPSMDSEALFGCDALTHAFLIRDPVEVIRSYAKVYSEMTIEETGLPYQVDLFNRVHRNTGKVPPVIDAKDVLVDPKRSLSRLCRALGIEFTERMLSWPAGPHAEDGNWGQHWYQSVYKSTGFEPYRPKCEMVPARYREILEESQRLYDQLAAHKL